jgi:hypothetical protein
MPFRESESFILLSQPNASVWGEEGCREDSSSGYVVGQEELREEDEEEEEGRSR